MIPNKVLFNIRRYREKSNFTQSSMADALGISTKSYSNLENGVSQLTLARLMDIAKIFKTDVHQLLDDSYAINFNNCTQDTGFMKDPIFINGESDLTIKHLEENVELLKGQIQRIKDLLQNNN